MLRGGAVGSAPNFRRRLFSDSEYVVNLDREVSSRALDLRVTEEKLYGG
jgi:hypothetical protein